MRTLTALACLLFMACQSQHQEPPVQEKSSVGEYGTQLFESFIAISDCSFNIIYGSKGGRMEMDAVMDELATCIEASGLGLDVAYIRETIGPAMYVLTDQGTIEDYFESEGIDPNTVPEERMKDIRILVEHSKSFVADLETLLPSLIEESQQLITVMTESLAADHEAQSGR